MMALVRTNRLVSRLVGVTTRSPQLKHDQNQAEQDEPGLVDGRQHPELQHLG